MEEFPKKKAQLFDMSIDQITNYNGSIPKEVILEDKTELEQIQLRQQIEEEDNKLFSYLRKKYSPIKSLKIFLLKKQHLYKIQNPKLLQWVYSYPIKVG